MILRQCLFLLITVSTIVSVAQAQKFVGRTVATGLHIPWEIQEAPDGLLWVSQRNGSIVRVHPDSGLKDTVLDFRYRIWVTRETGLLGFALHPHFADTPIAVVSYVERHNDIPYKVVSTFRFNDTILTDEKEIYRNEGLSWHQGGRVAFAPDGTVFISGGDQPEPWRTMDSSSPMGKLIRLNLDGSIPEDNPYPGYSTWTSGHRNVQGLLFMPDGTIITSEHGPDIEDEVNIIKKGANYGWPFVTGPCDTPDEEIACAQFNVTPPFWSTGPRTYALSDMAFYNHTRYPSLRNSILLCLLKSAGLIQLKLDESRTAVEEEITHFKDSFGRIRDVCVTSNGRVFIGTSNHENINFFPFPIAEDDRIIELVPVADTCIGIATHPDTIDVGQAVVGDSILFSLPFVNTGCGPFEITYIYKLGSADTSNFHSLVSRTPPIHIYPGDYPFAFMYKPRTPGVHVESILFGVVGAKNSADHLIRFRGTTSGAFLKAVKDSAFAEAQLDTIVEVIVNFLNVGDEPVIIDSISIDGLNANEFTTDFTPPLTVLPLATVSITVRHMPRATGARVANLHVHSNSFRDPDVVLASNVVVSSVEEGAEDGAEPLLYSYTVDLLGRVVDEHNITPGLYHRIRVTRKGVTCVPIIVR